MDERKDNLSILYIKLEFENQLINNCGRVAIVEDIVIVKDLLTRCSVDVNCETKFGKTPIYYACFCGFVETVKLLIEHGAELESKNNKWSNALHVACYGKRLTVIKILLDKGMDINVRDDQGRTAVFIACKNGYLAVAALLAAKNCDINLPDLHSRTPLRAAVSNGHVEVVSWLLKIGADYNIRDTMGNLPLQVTPHYQMYKCLLDGIFCTNKDTVLQNRLQSCLLQYSNNTQIQFLILMKRK